MRDHILDLARRRAQALSDIQLRRRLQLQIAEHIERLDAREAAGVAGDSAPTPWVKLSLFTRILLFFRLRKRVAEAGSPVMPESGAATIYAPRSAGTVNRWPPLARLQIR